MEQNENEGSGAGTKIVERGREWEIQQSQHLSNGGARERVEEEERRRL
jgi:hypothetical protein